jgi:hypothetical protein
MRDQRRGCSVDGEADREPGRRADAGVVPFARKPPERRSDEQRPESSARAARPGDEADHEQRRAGGQFGRHTRGREQPANPNLVRRVALDRSACEGIGGLASCDRDRESPEREPGEQDDGHDQALAAHVAIVRRARARLNPPALRV